MLKYEDAVFSKKVVAKNKIRYLRKVLQSIRWIGKDEIKLQVAAFQELEYISSDEIAKASLVPSSRGKPEFIETLTDKASVVAVFFHAYNLLASARKQFKRDASGASKEIKGSGILKIHVASYYIKYILLGKICCWSCLESAWHVKVTALVLSCDDAHIVRFSSEAKG